MVKRKKSARKPTPKKPPKAVGKPKARTRLPAAIATPPAVKPTRSYEKFKEQSRARIAEMSATGRDIGPIPPVENPERRARALKDFGFLCRAYFPEVFALEFSPDHERVIEKIQRAIDEGALFAFAMPRGSGKTSLCEAAVIAAGIYGRRFFVVLIGCSQKAAESTLESIKIELETNDLLLADFPEVCYPIRHLEGISNRANGQVHEGRRTLITWTDREIVLPTIEGSAASGVVIRAVGLTGSIRGMKHKRADGKSVRPDLVVPDDPQTDASARSPSQCEKRESLLAGAVLGLAGPGKKISGFMPCTVIQQGDMSDNILDRNKHPEWQGERTKLLYARPTNEKLWGEYYDLRARCQREELGTGPATEFYDTHREEMDSGAIVAWEQRYNPDELSAVQHCMNLMQDLGEEAFAAEYQNEPLKKDAGDADALTPDLICSKLSRIKRGIVPVECEKLVAFIDVQKELLFYCVVAWSADFTGSVVDYGTWPDQDRSDFTLRNATRTLSKRYRSAAGDAGLEERLFAGLTDLTQHILGREWTGSGGSIHRIERCPIDANWGQSTDLVYKFCRQCAFPTIVIPSHGSFIRASSAGMSSWAKKPGEKIGNHWVSSPPKAHRAIRHSTWDANWWKSFIAARLRVGVGGRGGLTVFGDSPAQHRMFAEHCTAETCVPVEALGRRVDEWHQKPNHPDNHLWDCVVGCGMAGSMQGCELMRGAPPPSKKRKKIHASYF